jgi:hypothetical protein
VGCVFALFSRQRGADSLNTFRPQPGWAGPGFVVIVGLVRRQRLERWTALFLGTTIATGLLGFLFPVDRITPAHVLGVFSLTLLTVAVVVLCGRQLVGPGGQRTCCPFSQPSPSTSLC